MASRCGLTMELNQKRRTGETVESVVTPSGIEIAFYPKNEDLKIKRHYELRSVDGLIPGSLATKERFIPWKEVPSVTDVLDVLWKPLVWWGMEKGAEGTRELLNKGYAVGRMSTEELTAALGREQLTVNQVRDKAGSRGKAVHNAFETWAETGAIPVPEMFPEEESGYVRGLVSFLNDVRPVPQASEVMVASLKNSFAGRYDCRLRIPKLCEVVQRTFPKRKPKKATLRPGVILCDLKTSKYVYASHHLQIEAYEGASIESGYGESNHRGILHVTSDGRYQFVPSRGTYQGFLAVKSVYDEMEAMKGRK